LKSLSLFFAIEYFGAPVKKRIQKEDGNVVDFDTYFFHMIHGWAGHWESVDWAMQELSRERNLFIPIILLLGYWAWGRRGEALWIAPILAVGVGLSDFLGGQLKHIIGRPRPCQIFVNSPEMVGCGGLFSFPSNHALNSATAAAFLSMLYPSTKWVAWPIVGCIGLSRVFLGAHYVTDVIGGWAIGGIIGVSLAWAVLGWSRFSAIQQERG